MSSGKSRISGELTHQRQPVRDASASGSSQRRGASSSQPQQPRQLHVHRQTRVEVTSTQVSYGGGDNYSQEYFEGVPVYRHPHRHRRGGGGGGGGEGDEGGWNDGGPSSSQRPTQPLGGLDATQPVGQCLSYDPEEEEEEEEKANQGWAFAFLVGHGELSDVVLYDRMEELTFGAGDDCDIQLPHTKLGVNPTDDKLSRPWFRLFLKHHDSRDTSSKDLCPPSVYVEDVSGFGTYLDGRKVLKPQRVRWGTSIGGSASEEYNSFRYTFRNKSTEAPFKVVGKERTYVVGHILGDGMYATVREATDERDATQKYACKDIDKTRRSFNSAELECIRYELEILKSVEHENIIRFVDECREGPHIYIFTEYVHGQTLHDYYRQENNYLDEVTARNIIKQVCNALRYLHNLGIVHRDVKSENVMLDAENKVKLIDFGLARSLSSEKPLKNICGTYAYMAPETALGEERNSYSTPVDVWSVGVLLFRMIAGRYPFNDTSDSSEEAAAVSQTVEPAKAEHRKFEEARLDDIPEPEVKKEEETEYKPTVQLNDNETASSGSKTPPQEEKQIWGKKVDYEVDWMPHVDFFNRRTDHLKSLLKRFLELDPSKRITMSQALKHYWLKIHDEQLHALEMQCSHRADSTKPDDLESAASSSAQAPWAQMELIPGSIDGVPDTIHLVKDQTFFGRGKGVDVHLGTDRFLSNYQCLIQQEKDGVIMLLDNGINPTHINNLKIGRGMACQIFNNDIIGFITPPDDMGLDLPSARPRNNTQRFLKYRILINNAPEITPNQAHHRRLLAQQDPSMVLQSRNFAMDAVTRINAEREKIRRKRFKIKPDCEEWGWLEPLNENTQEERLKSKVVSIGRALESDVCIDNIGVSRNHCRLRWERPMAYIDDCSYNFLSVSAIMVNGSMQLRDGDKIRIVGSKDKQKEIGYIFHYAPEHQIMGPPAKRSRNDDDDE